MKTIMIYSGKGGVGKTTITSILAKYLIDKGNRVCIIDADLNTPSMPVVFPDRKSDNLLVISTGYTHKNKIFFSGVSDFVLKNMLKESRDFKPDYILIDTPPSITEIHFSIIKYFIISSILIVSENSELSFSDVKRTVNIYSGQEIPTAGIIINKVKPNEKLDIPDELKSLKILSIIEDDVEIKRLTRDGNILSKDLSNFKIDFDFESLLNVDWLEFKNEILLFDESIDEKAIDLMIDSSKYSSKYRSGNWMKVFKFYNLKTWDYIISLINEETDDNVLLGSMRLLNDDFLKYNDARTIKRLLDGFKEENRILVNVLRNPQTEISLFPGEVGYATLILGENSYYGVPRVKYLTDEGNVILFPHECSPANAPNYINTIERAIKEEDLVPMPGSKSTRYIPSIQYFNELNYSFGNLMGINDETIEKHNKLFGMNS